MYAKQNLTIWRFHSFRDKKMSPWLRRNSSSSSVSTSSFKLLTLKSTSHNNWCTGTLLNRTTTAQWEGMGDVGSARYEPALLPPCLTIRILRNCNCQEIHPLLFEVNFQIFSTLRVFKLFSNYITFLHVVWSNGQVNSHKASVTFHLHQFSNKFV